MADNDKKLIAPYVEWAIATNFAYLTGEWFRVLLELNEAGGGFRSTGSTDSTSRRSRPYPADLPNPSAEFEQGRRDLLHGDHEQEGAGRLVPARARTRSPGRLATGHGALIRIELGTPRHDHLQHAIRCHHRHATGFNAPQAQSLPSSMTDWPSRTNAFARPIARTQFKYFWNQDDSDASNATAGIWTGAAS